MDLNTRLESLVAISYSVRLLPAEVIICNIASTFEGSSSVLTVNQTIRASIMNQKPYHRRQSAWPAEAFAFLNPSGSPLEDAAAAVLAPARQDTDRGRSPSSHAQRKLLIKTLDEALKMVSKDIDDGKFD